MGILEPWFYTHVREMLGYAVFRVSNPINRP